VAKITLTLSVIMFNVIFSIKCSFCRQLLVSCVLELVSLLLLVSCHASSAASTSVQRNSSFHQLANLKLSIAVAICHQKRKLFFRGWWLLYLLCKSVMSVNICTVNLFIIIMRVGDWESGW